MLKPDPPQIGVPPVFPSNIIGNQENCGFDSVLSQYGISVFENTAVAVVKRQSNSFRRQMFGIDQLADSANFKTLRQQKFNLTPEIRWCNAGNAQLMFLIDFMIDEYPIC